jgi:hypothetical protein
LELRKIKEHLVRRDEVKKGRRLENENVEGNPEHFTCLTSLYISLSNVNRTYDCVPIIARQSSSNFVLSEEPSSKL